MRFQTYLTSLNTTGDTVVHAAVLPLSAEGEGGVALCAIFFIVLHDVFGIVELHLTTCSLFFLFKKKTRRVRRLYP